MSTYSNNFFYELGVLSQRNTKNIFRNPILLVGRLIQTCNFFPIFNPYFILFYSVFGFHLWVHLLPFGHKPKQPSKHHKSLRSVIFHRLESIPNVDAIFNFNMYAN